MTVLFCFIWWFGVVPLQENICCHERAVVVCVVFTWRKSGKAQARIPHGQGGTSFIVHLVVWWSASHKAEYAFWLALCGLVVGLMNILFILTMIQCYLINQKAKRVFFIVIFFIKNAVNIFSCSGKSSASAWVPLVEMWNIEQTGWLILEAWS